MGCLLKRDWIRAGQEKDVFAAVETRLHRFGLPRLAAPDDIRPETKLLLKVFGNPVRTQIVSKEQHALRALCLCENMELAPGKFAFGLRQRLARYKLQGLTRGSVLERDLVDLHRHRRLGEKPE